MSNIPFTMSNVAETVVMAINADATLSVGGAGNRLVFAGIVISAKGKPFELLSINRDNLRNTLGKPYHPSKGIPSESLRHAAEAVKGGNGLVVRVVPDDAKYPVITVSPPAKSKAKSLTKSNAEEPAAEEVSATVNVLAASSVPYTTDLELSEGAAFAIAIADGDASTNRFIEMVDLDAEQYGAGMYQLNLYERDAAGFDNKIASNICSFDPEATNDNGTPAYIETVLENTQLQVVVDLSVVNSLSTKSFPRTQFVGGTDGDISAITSEAYEKAIAVINASVARYTHVLGLGCYDVDVIKKLNDIADGRRIGGYYDLDPRLSYADAADAKVAMAMNAHRACFYHFPYDAMDPTYKCRAVWGISGLAFTAKAIGVAKTAPTGGYHYTPAGEERALIPRNGCRLLKNAGTPDFEKMYNVRINKMGVTQAGYLFIDDSLTSSVRESDLRFEQVVSVTDVISRDVVDLANRIKHNPDGVTEDGLYNGVVTICENYATTGALVQPKDPSEGKEPYRFIISKADKDAWKIQLRVCVTGSGRRFIIEPILIP